MVTLVTVAKRRLYYSKMVTPVTITKWKQILQQQNGNSCYCREAETVYYSKTLALVTVANWKLFPVYLYGNSTCAVK